MSTIQPETYPDGTPTRRTLKDRVFLEIAVKLGELGTCDRAKVGAVITKDGRAVSWGFNGAPPGLPHCNENWHGYKDETFAQTQFMPPYDKGYYLVRNPIRQQFPVGDGPPKDVHSELVQPWDEAEKSALIKGCNNATHAEANALAAAAKQGISTEGGTLYVVVSPCVNCARLLIAAGIVRVVAATKYRNEAGLELLYDAQVEVSVLG